MTEQDLERLTAARRKRERKLEKYPNTPQAAENRRGEQWYADEWGSLYTFPKPWEPETNNEQTRT